MNMSRKNSKGQDTAKAVEELDLSRVEEDPGMGIPGSGFWCEDPNREIQAEIETNISRFVLRWRSTADM
jgi:hypothetical protein